MASKERRVLEKEIVDVIEWTGTAGSLNAISNGNGGIRDMSKRTECLIYKEAMQGDI